MKKLTVILAVIALILSFAACSKEKSTSEHSHDHNHGSENGSVVIQANTHTGYDESAPKLQAEGTTNENTYTNVYLGLTFTKPDSWSFFPKDALAGLTGAGVTVSVADAADSLGAAYDMMAVDYTTNSSVSLVFENLEVTAGSTMSAKDYVDNVIKTALETTPDSTLTEETEITIGESTYLKVTITNQSQNTTMVKTHYLRCVDKYMIHITATAPENVAATTDFDSMFS